MIRRWLADRRWRRTEAAREAWVVYVDLEGRECSNRVPVVLHPSHVGSWLLAGTITHTITQPGILAAARVIFADGTTQDVPLPRDLRPL